MKGVNEIFQKYVENEVAVVKKDTVFNLTRLNQSLLAFLCLLGKLSEQTVLEYDSTQSLQINLNDYLRGLNILLSIGYELKVDSIKNYTEITQNNTVLEWFYKVYEGALRLKNSYQFEDYQSCIDDYLGLGFSLGLSLDEIVNQYL